MSPENGVPGKRAAVCDGTAMDAAIVADTFETVIAWAKVLKTDAAYADELAALLPRLEPLRVGRWGQLQEWTGDYDNPNDRHRHTSHLYALYPSDRITSATPALFAAARTSLEHRGDESTGCAHAADCPSTSRGRTGRSRTTASTVRRCGNSPNENENKRRFMQLTQR